MSMLIKDLQYLLSKRLSYAKKLQEENKVSSHIMQEAAVLQSAIDLIAEQSRQLKELLRQAGEATKNRKNERIAKAVWCQANSEIWYNKGDMTYTRKLLRIYNNPEAAISEWKFIVQSMDIDEKMADILEDRLDYYNPEHYEFYKSYLKDCFIDIKLREKQWREKTDARIKNSQL